MKIPRKPIRREQTLHALALAVKSITRQLERSDDDQPPRRPVGSESVIRMERRTA